MKMFLAVPLPSLSPCVTFCFKLYPDTILCNILPEPSGSLLHSLKPKKWWPSVPSWLQDGGSDIIHHEDFQETAWATTQTLQNVTQREIPIFILILFHYQLFLLVRKSIVFLDRLWAKEDLDSRAGRQPVLKMHCLVWGSSNYVSVKPNVLCICKFDGPIIFLRIKLFLCTGKTELVHKCDGLSSYSCNKFYPSCWFNVSLLCECN